MGYLIESHVLKEDVDLNLLGKILSDFSVRAFRIPDVNATFLDFYPSRLENNSPFQGMRSKSIPLDLPPQYEILSVLYKMLVSCRAGNSFKRAFINLNIEISSVLKTKVLSFLSDDDGLDLAVISDLGIIKKLRFRADDIEVNFDGRTVDIFPLITEEGEAIIDLSIFTGKNIIVHEREKSFSSLLHQIAAEELKAFLNTERLLLGLSSFDLPEHPLEKVFQLDCPPKPVKLEATATVQRMPETLRTLIVFAISLAIVLIGCYLFV